MKVERWCENHGWIDSRYWKVGRNKLLQCSSCGGLLTSAIREVSDE